MNGLLAELVPFIGQWEGIGWEVKPAGARVGFRERIELCRCDRSVLSYRKAFYTCSGQLVALTRGFLTAPSPREIHMISAASAGQVETGSGNVWHEGEWTVARVLSEVHSYPDMPATDASERRYRLRGDLMFADLDIQYMSGDLRRLTSRLTKVTAPQ